MIPALAIVGWVIVFFLVGVLILQSAGKERPVYYQHYKGGVYEFRGLARHHENPQVIFVVYRHEKTGTQWVREEDNFFSEVDDTKCPRFRKL